MNTADDVKSPKYKKIYRSIKDAIGSGEYKPGQRLPSESELVGAFGASRITVNRALRELQLAGIIDRRAGSGSYVRAQPERSYTFGLLIPELGETEIFEPICRGMALAEETEHRHALLWSKTLGDAEPKESHATELCQRMVSQKVAGAFFAPLELTPTKDAVNQVIVETFSRAGIPIVLLDRDLVAYPARSRYDLVGIDNRRAGYTITAHMLEVGCRRAAFVGRPGSAPTVEARIAGYREAILDSHCEWDPNFVQRIAPWDHNAVKEMLATVKPDGIVCANDFTAANLMKTLGALGVRVPEEVRLAGIDDVKYASLLPVPLTTIHQPCAKMGAAAVAAMLQRIHNPGLPARDILLDFHLVVRESTVGRAAHPTVA
ncbi:MAG TPA: GntR family transcriptional regulator [Bryobacteraceae bacterium]|nr:GntR family transcriptional regulator [Bryobacteraceae bacterium]